MTKRQRPIKPHTRVVVPKLRQYEPPKPTILAMSIHLALRYWHHADSLTPEQWRAVGVPA